jgi:putative transposase
VPTTLTIVYRHNTGQWFASITVNVPEVTPKFGSESELNYESIVAYELGCSTAMTTYDGTEFEEITNPRFTQKTEKLISHESKKLRRKRSPNRKKGIKGSSRWRKNKKRVSKLQRKCANQRKNWQHQITSDIASRYDIGVTEKLNPKNMTKKAKTNKGRNQKAGLNKSILSVGFGELNKMLTYKIEEKGGLMIILDTKKVKPSQRCPKCGKVHKQWAELSNRYHQCDHCQFEIPRDKGSVMVMYNVATNQQKGLGTSLSKRGCFSSTSENKLRKHTGSMKQLGQMKRQKSQNKAVGEVETPSVFTAG